ncbi:MAG: GAF domain-containing sensor histidine kinase [Dehalococcoidia bacterium]
MLSRLGQQIASSLDLTTVFQQVVDSACELTSARYGALGIFDRHGQIEQFITHGLTDEEQDRIGRLPEGLGVLGWLRDLQEPLRLGDLTKHPRSAGFPSNHPAMKTFLGAPIRHGAVSLGNLYLTEKAEEQDFTPEDENLLVLFAAQAAMAIRNAQLHRQVQDLAILEERDRIGMDLHDGVIQSLYATGLKLESVLDDMAKNPQEVASEVGRAIDQLNQVIGDIRSYIFHLRPTALSETDLAGAVGGLLRELKVNTLIDVEMLEAPGACRGLDQELAGGLFLVAKEAIANAQKHAKAKRVSASLERYNGTLKMIIADDGSGFDPALPSSGLGLHNVRERIERLGGTLSLESSPRDGTRIVVEVPVAAGN